MRDVVFFILLSFSVQQKGHASLQSVATNRAKITEEISLLTDLSFVKFDMLFLNM